MKLAVLVAASALAVSATLAVAQSASGTAGGSSKAGGPSATAGTWMSLGPQPLPSDAGGTGLQDYGFVSGRANSVAITGEE